MKKYENVEYKDFLNYDLYDKNVFKVVYVFNNI